MFMKMIVIHPDDQLEKKRMDIWKSWSIENASDFFNFDVDQIK